MVHSTLNIRARVLAPAVGALLILAAGASTPAGTQGPGERICTLEIHGAGDLSDSGLLMTPFCQAGDGFEPAWRPCSTIRRIEPSSPRLSMACPGAEGPGGFLLTGEGIAPHWLESGRLDPNIPAIVELTRGTSLVMCIKSESAPDLRGLVQLVMESPVAIPSGGVLRPEVKPTGADGCLEWPNLPGFSGHLVISALGFKSQVKEVSARTEIRELAMAVELTPVKRKTLPVRNETGEPLDIGMARIDWTVGYASARTMHVQIDPNGHVDLPYFDVGAMDLEVHSPCCSAFQAQSIRPAEFLEMTRITLRRFGEVTGRVVLEEEADEPVEGARICLQPMEGQEDGESQVCVKSGRDGTFTAGGLRDGFHRVSVEVSDRPRLVLPGVLVEPAGSTDLEEILVPPGATVRVQVLDGTDGGAVPGAVLVLDREEFGLPWGALVETSTDERGMAVLRGFREGPYRFRVTSQHHSPKLVELEANLNDESIQEVVLTPGGMLTGTVLQNGEPAAGDRIVIPLAPEPYISTVDDLGSYRIERLPPGTVTVERHTLSGESVQLKEAVISPGAESVLNFGVGLDLAGQIYLRGEPLRGARLALLRIRSWERSQKGQAGELMQATAVSPSISPEILTAITDLRGEFIVGGLDPGEYSLTVVYESSTQTRRLDVSQDLVEPVRIEVAEYELIGSVTFGNTGEPAAQARILATLSGGTGGSYSRMGEVAGQQVTVDTRESGRTGSGAAGEFSLYLPLSGPWQVMAFAGDSVSEQVLVEDVSAGPIDIEIHPRSAINVWVQGPGGVEADVARVHAMRIAPGATAPSRSIRSTDRAGKVQLRGIQGEEWWIAATHPSFGMSEMRRVRYPSSGEISERLELGRGATLSVLFERESHSGTAPPWEIRHLGSGLSLRGIIPEPVLESGSDHERMIFRRLPSTRLTVMVEGREASISIEPGATQSLDLTSTPEIPGGRGGGLR